ncbi:MAG: tRNA-dihydrouridine synthase family protein [Treponema sp.]|nr:tRNA-dihydrouridine synthase family protein [Treponema sp.]
MAELSHRALRQLISDFMYSKRPQNPPGGVLYFTEMISAAGLLAGGSFEKWYLDNGPCPEQLVYQLLGADSEQLVKAAVQLDRQECFGIDINMGCSAPAITRTGAGVRWMEDPDKAARLIEALRKVTKKQLSVKIRLAPKIAAASDWTQIMESLVAFCRGLEGAGVDLITLHPRLAAEKLKRKARWEYVEVLRKELHIPIAGNGDVNSAEELKCKAAEGPVMAGRLLVRQPWAFAAVFGSNEPAVNIEETGLRFLELLARHQPPEFHLSRARRFFKYYCDNVTWAEYLRNKINREENLAGIERVWRDARNMHVYEKINDEGPFFTSPYSS